MVSKENEQKFTNAEVLKAKANLDEWFLKLVEIGYGKIEITFAKSNDLIEVIPQPRLRSKG